MGNNGTMAEKKFIERYLTESYKALVGTVAFAMFDMRNGYYMRIRRLRVGEPIQKYRVNYYKMGEQGLENAAWDGRTNNIFANSFSSFDNEIIGFDNLLDEMKKVAAFKRDEHAHIPLALDVLDKKPVNYFEVLNAVQPPEPGNVRVETEGRPGGFFNYSRRQKTQGFARN
jgi:hypothetical protein